MLDRPHFLSFSHEEENETTLISRLGVASRRVFSHEEHEDTQSFPSMFKMKASDSEFANPRKHAYFLAFSNIQKLLYSFNVVWFPTFLC